MQFDDRRLTERVVPCRKFWYTEDKYIDRKRWNDHAYCCQKGIYRIYDELPTCCASATLPPRSGRKTPYFVNTGNYKTGLQNSRLGEFYAALVKETVGDQFDAMFGPAYKGIPLATSVSGALARNYGIDKPFFFNRKEAKDHGEGGSIVGYKPQDGDRVIIIEDVITAGTAIRETMPVLKGCADVKVTDMFISVNRCEVGQNPGKTAVMEVGEEFGIKVHALVTVQDIREYLADKEEYAHLLPLMDAYMKQYCVF